MGVLFLLVACTAPKTVPAPTPPSPSSAIPTAFRYEVGQLENALPATYGGHRFETRGYAYPVSSNWTIRADPLAGRAVVPEACRDTIWNGGNKTRPGDFVPGNTPSADASAELGPRIGDLQPNLRATVVELTGELADSYLDWYRPTPDECAHIRVDRAEQASVVERSVVAFGDRSRLVVRTFPVRGRTWTEHILLYRTAQYVAEIRWDGYSVTESHFLAFARVTRDRLTAELKG